MDFFFVAYFFFYAVGLFLIGIFDAHRHMMFGYSLGAFILLADIFVLFWAWHRIFFKKSVVLSTSVIVLKYSVLVLVLYWVTPQVGAFPLALGFGVLLPSVLSMALKGAL